MIFFIATIALFIWVTYTAMELRKATLAAGTLLVVYTLIGNPSTIYISCLWILLVYLCHSIFQKSGEITSQKES